jgi:hypothetical protein
MKDLVRDIRHLDNDVKIIHDHLEHLSSHSKICNDLVKESNLREATELFMHLSEVDNLIHSVQKHIVHIQNHLDQDSIQESNIDIIDIDDLKHDAKHTSFDLKDIHSHIEHLIKHSEMCQNIITPNAEKELLEIKNHLMDIDNVAHELLDHINDIRGEISTKYSEFIWTIPDSFDFALIPTTLINSDNETVEKVAFKLVDGSESAWDALIRILCFVRDFINPNVKDEQLDITASDTLNTKIGTSDAKSILACALARAVSIPSKVHFAKVTPDMWNEITFLEEIVNLEIIYHFSISWPEFYIDDKWLPAFEILDCKVETFSLHEKFLELGIKHTGPIKDPEKWKRLPVEKFIDQDSFYKPIKFLRSPEFVTPILEIKQRLFAGFLYTG